MTSHWINTVKTLVLKAKLYTQHETIIQPQSLTRAIMGQPVTCRSKRCSRTAHSPPCKRGAYSSKTCSLPQERDSQTTITCLNQGGGSNPILPDNKQVTLDRLSFSKNSVKCSANFGTLQHYSVKCSTLIGTLQRYSISRSAKLSILNAKRPVIETHNTVPPMQHSPVTLTASQLHNAAWGLLVRATTHLIVLQESYAV